MEQTDLMLSEDDLVEFFNITPGPRVDDILNHMMKVIDDFGSEFNTKNFLGVVVANYLRDNGR